MLRRPLHRYIRIYSWKVPTQFPNYFISKLTFEENTNVSQISLASEFNHLESKLLFYFIFNCQDVRKYYLDFLRHVRLTLIHIHLPFNTRRQYQMLDGHLKHDRLK